MDREEFDGRYGKVIDDKFYVVCDPDGLLYLPEDMTIPGDLILPDGGLYDLPAGLTVEGNLDLGGTGIYTVWPNLTVKGTLTLTGSYVTKLPDHVSAGRLELKNSAVTEIGKYLKVGSDMFLEGTNVEKIGSHLSVDGTLFLTSSKIKTLPAYVEVRKLIAASSELSKISDHLEVRFDPLSSKEDCLDLSNTKITELGEHTFVDGSLDLSNTEISSLPAHLWIGCKGYNIENIKNYGGSRLILKNTPVSSLPDNLHAEVLDLRDTNISSFGENIEVLELFLGDRALKGDSEHIKAHIVYVDGRYQDAVDFAFSINPRYELIIKNGSPLLPKNLSLPCTLKIEDAKLDYFPENAFLANLELRNTSFPLLPKPLDIKHGTVTLDGKKTDCLIEDGFECGTVKILGASIKTLPANLTCKELSIKGVPVSSLPGDLTAPMDIYLANTALKILPNNLEIRKLRIDNSENSSEIWLPDSLVIIEEYLSWKNFPYEIIPDNLVVLGGMSLTEGRLIWLPDDLIINGDLDISCNPISELPENLLVYGDLNIESTNIKVLPASLKVSGTIHGSEKCITGFCSNWESATNHDGRISEHMRRARYSGTTNNSNIPDGRIPSWHNGRFIRIPYFGNFEVMERQENRIRLRKICTREMLWVEKGTNKGINILFG